MLGALAELPQQGQLQGKWGCGSPWAPEGVLGTATVPRVGTRGVLLWLFCEQTRRFQSLQVLGWLWFRLGCGAPVAGTAARSQHGLLCQAPSSQSTQHKDALGFADTRAQISRGGGGDAHTAAIPAAVAGGCGARCHCQGGDRHQWHGHHLGNPVKSARSKAKELHKCYKNSQSAPRAGHHLAATAELSPEALLGRWGFQEQHRCHGQLPGEAPASQLLQLSSRHRGAPAVAMLGASICSLYLLKPTWTKDSCKIPAQMPGNLPSAHRRAHKEQHA